MPQRHDRLVHRVSAGATIIALLRSIRPRNSVHVPDGQFQSSNLPTGICLPRRCSYCIVPHGAALSLSFVVVSGPTASLPLGYYRTASEFLHSSTTSTNDSIYPPPSAPKTATACGPRFCFAAHMTQTVEKPRRNPNLKLFVKCVPCYTIVHSVGATVSCSRGLFIFPEPPSEGD